MTHNLTTGISSYPRPIQPDPMDRLIAAADALADAGKALRTWDGRPTAEAKSEWDEAMTEYRAAARRWQADARRAQAEAIEAGLMTEKLYAALEPFSEVAGSLFIANANANDIIVKTSSIALRFSAFLDARRAYVSATAPKK